MGLQQNPYLSRATLRPVKNHLVTTASVRAVTVRANRLASASPGTAGAWLQAVLFTLLTWAVLIGAGIGGSLGAASQNLATKLATHAQHLQRHAGTANASRGVRQDLPAAAAATAVARTWVSEWHLALVVPLDGALPASGFPTPPDAPQGHGLDAASGEWHVERLDPAHPCRAPPVLA